jgi:hypothetical protein
MKTANQILLESIRESEFQSQIVDTAQKLRWLVYHTHDSRRSAAGYPDLTLVRRDRLIFAEVKTEKGKTSPAQEIWLKALEDAGCKVFVWKPSMFDKIIEVLK